MPSGTWTKWLANDVQLRTRMALDRRGNVTHFTVQLEMWLDKWVPVVRYDNAHQEAHIDYINPKGVTYRKEWLNLRSPFNGAMTRAEDELEEGFPEQITRFRQQMEGKLWLPVQQSKPP